MPAVMALLASEWTPSAIGGLLFAVFAGTGVLVGALGLFFRGLSAKYVDPVIEKGVKDLYKNEDFAKERAEELTKAVSSYYDSPTRAAERVVLVKDIINNEIMRKDGMLHTEITQRVTAVETDFTRKLEESTRELKEGMHSLTSTVKEQSQATQSSNQEVIYKLGLLQGQIEMSRDVPGNSREPERKKTLPPRKRTGR